MRRTLKAFLRYPFSRTKRDLWLSRTTQDRVRASTPELPVFGADTDGLLGERLFESWLSTALGRYTEGDHVPLAPEPTPPSISDVRLVAYYLPQFHPIPENDAWWGPGFTEWRNVARAFPNFVGHYQPRLPGELGYYDLRVPEVMARQVELARHHGLSAFCFHFYWFGGRTLLEMPIRQFLERKELDFGFSLCWANENWSRRWDGSEDQVLIAQRHSPEDDEAFLRHVNAYFRDDRYLKINGRPVLTVYRPSELPDARATTERWRALARRLGWPDLYLVATSAFGFHQYRELGFDALSEFASFRVTAPNVEPNFETTEFRSAAGIRLYRDVVAAELRKPEIEGKVHPGLMLAWDNSARRPARGNIVHGITVQDFRRWLGHCVARARRNPPQERLVFINAWNEWAEGTYLEPDRRFGYAFLSACAEVLRETAPEARKSRDTAAAPSSGDEGSA
jgi:lipopolysaccharide biosynthesis protein